MDISTENTQMKIELSYNTAILYYMSLGVYQKESVKMQSKCPHAHAFCPAIYHNCRANLS